MVQEVIKIKNNFDIFIYSCMLKAVKVRLYPNTNQEIYIAKLLGSYRFVYNNCLGLKKLKIR